MDQSSNRDILDIAVEADFRRFINDNTSEYDLAARDLEVRYGNEKSNLDILYLDLDSKVFRIDDFIIDETGLGELRKELTKSSKILEKRIDSIELNDDIQWSGQYRIRQLNGLNQTEPFEGDMYAHSDLTEEDMQNIDELSRNLLGYSIEHWNEYDLI